MIYVTDIPNQANIERFYRDYSHYKGLRSGKPSYLRIKLFDWHNPHLLILKMTGGVKGKNLCEVGCSFGSFLQQAKNNGACVSGVELDENATEYLKHIGIPCVKTVDTKKTFDIVCAFQLIEHLSDPGQFVKEISSVLPENERFMLALPNGGEAEKVGPAWIGFRVDLEHFNYFSVQSLSILRGKPKSEGQYYTETRV